MKILRIVYDWPEPWAGLAPHPYELTIAQAKRGHEVTVFAGKWPKSGRMLVPEGVTVKGFLREPLKGTLAFTTSLLLFFYYLNWRRTNRPDLVHIHGHFALWILGYRRLLRKLHPSAQELAIPLVAHFHNTVEGRKRKLQAKGSTISWISKYVSWPLALLSDRWAIQEANGYIFVSDGLKQEAIEFYGADPSKCFVIRTGVNVSLFKPVSGEEKEKTRRDLGLDVEDVVLLNYGMQVRRKNTLNLVLALKHLPPHYKVLLIGPGDPDYLSEIDDAIADNQLQGRVIRGGYMPYPQMPIALQAADAFVLPSSFEGLPKAVLEALSCGVPVLASGFKIQDQVSGLIYLSDISPESIASAVKQLMSEAPVVDRTYVRLHYSWDTRAAELDSVYTQILEH